MNSLRRLRKAFGLTLDELSAKAKISKSSLSKIELDKQTLYIDQAITLANIFNVSLDELVGRPFIVPEKTIVKTRDFEYEDILKKLVTLDNHDLSRLYGAIDLVLDNRLEQNLEPKRELKFDNRELHKP